MTRWTRANSTMTGTMLMMPPAASVPQGSWNSPTMSCRPTGQVREPGLVVSISANRNSFQAAIATNTEVATRPPGDQRQDHAHHRADPRAAVDARRVLELERDGVEEALHHPDEHRQQEAGVGERQARGGVSSRPTFRIRMNSGMIIITAGNMRITR